MIPRRGVLARALGALGVALLVPTRPILAQSGGRQVQVRVYRQPRPGRFEFLAGIPVRLCDGQTGRTRSGPGITGTVEFRNVICRNFFADALVNGRWIRSSRSETIGRVLRLDVVVP